MGGKNRTMKPAATSPGRNFVMAWRWPGQMGQAGATVLRRWNITSTLDFGRIVFALIAAGNMQKTDEDTLEDFRNVYDFKNTFETGYRIRPRHEQSHPLKRQVFRASGASHRSSPRIPNSFPRPSRGRS